MQTHPAANGNTLQQHKRPNRKHHRNSSHPQSQSQPQPPLLRLPTDVWLHIFAALRPDATPTLNVLSTTCSHTLRLVDQYGWKDVLTQDYGSVHLDRLDGAYRAYSKKRRVARSKWWFACRYASLLRRCWSEVTLQAGSIDLPAGEKKGARARRFGVDFAIPTLTVGTKRVVVGARSELFVYHAASVQLQSRIRLNSRPGDTASSETATAASSRVDDPWQDITALEALDTEASTLVVGYADGCVQVVALKRTAKGHSVEAEVMRHWPLSRRQEVAGISLLGPATVSGSNRLASGEFLIASLSKRGLLRLHRVELGGDGGSEMETKEWTWQIDSEGTAMVLDQHSSAPVDDSSGASTPRTNFRSAAFNNATPVSPHDASSANNTRAWSILLGSCADARQRPPHDSADEWVAVGMTAEHAVYIYPLSHLQLQEPFYVASTGQRTSVYAMATPPAWSSVPAFLLFVGFFDGVVRVYDTRQLRSAVHSEADGLMRMDGLSDALGGARRGRRVRRELDPIAVFREDYDTDAIYTLSFGGPRGEVLVVGGARHAKVRIFDVSALARYDVPLLSAPGGALTRRDWTAFALPSTDSPVYQVVGHADKVLGVTDRKLWWFDFGSTLLDADTKGDSVAFFRHGHGELCYSSPSH